MGSELKPIIFQSIYLIIGILKDQTCCKIEKKKTDQGKRSKIKITP